MGLLLDVGPVETALAPLLAYEYPAVDLTPTMCLSEPAARAVQARSLQSLLDDINATRDAVELLEEKLEYLKRGLRRQEAAVKTALAPVTGLPFEVLRVILLAALAQAPTSGTSLTLSHVNARWRALSLNTRELWETIEVPNHCGGSEMFEAFALRSGTLPLRIVKLGPDPETYHTAPIDIKLLPIHGPRISSIELHSDADSEQWLSSLEACAANMAMQDLAFLNTRTAMPVQYFLFGGMASTRSLRLDRASIINSNGCQMDRLDTLSISNIHYEEIETILDSLCGAPLLRVLGLSCITADADEEARFIDAHGYDAGLTSLAIECCSDKLWISPRHWAMPNLTSLTVVNENVFLSPACWFGLLSHSLNLETLSLTVSGLFSGPTVSQLCVFLSAYPGHNLVALQSLSIRVHGVELEIMHGRADFVLGVIEMRASPDSGVARLRYLSLSQCLVPREREDWLREIVGTLVIERD